jgi:hypothetical protein
MEMLIMPMGPGTYGSQKGRPKKKSFIKQVDAPKDAAKKKATGQLKLNMKKMPPVVQKRLMQAMKKKRG